MPDPEDIKVVKDLLQAIIKAKKNLKIYPVNNPIYAKTVTNTYLKLEAIFEYLDEIPLRMTRNEILYGGESVFKGVGKDDNLALLFSRDGLKDLIFKNGLTREEFQGFLEIVSYDFDSEDITDDVITLLWEKDFQHIKYTVDESILVEEDEEDYEEEAVKQVKERSADEDDLTKAYSDALKSEETAKEIQLVPITDKDVKALAVLREKVARDKKVKLIDILYEMLLMSEDFYEFHEITAIVANALEYSVRQGDLRTAIEILWRAKTFDDTAVTEFDSKEELNHIFRSAESPEIIKVIGDMMDEEPGIEDIVLQEYVSFLSRNSIPQFITILGELKTIKARKSVVNALVFLGGKDIAVLAKGLSDSRWYVVRNIIYVLRKIGDPKALDYLLRAAGHNDPRVRKELLKTLGESKGGPKAAAVVKDCLDDPEPFVRTTAARALGSIGSDFAKRVMLDRLSDGKFLSVDFNEKKEFFEVLSRWRDSAVFDFLMKTVKKRALFKRAKYNENKAVAVYALGLMGNKGALPVLEKLRRSSNRFLSEYAYAAIKRIEYGKQG